MHINDDRRFSLAANDETAESVIVAVKVLLSVYSSARQTDTRRRICLYCCYNSLLRYDALDRSSHYNKFELVTVARIRYSLFVVTSGHWFIPCQRHIGSHTSTAVFSVGAALIFLPRHANFFKSSPISPKPAVSMTQLA